MKNLILVLSLGVVGCVSFPRKRNFDQNIVANYYQAYNQRDVDAQVKLMSDDLIHQSNSDSVTHGSAAYRKYTESVNADVREEVYAIQYVVDSENSKVAAQSRVRGEYIGKLKDFPKADGQKYDLPLVEVFEIKNGKISKLSTYYNELMWEQQVKNSKK